MRKIIVVLLLFLAVAFVIASFSELEKTVSTLERSDWRFLIAALIFEVIWIYNMATTFRTLYQLVDLNENSRHLFLVSAAANFVNVVAPSAGIGGMAVFLEDAKKRNHSTGRVTVVGALFVLFDYAAFICVLTLGLIVLFRRNNLNAGEIAASLILLAIAMTLGLLVYLGSRSAAALSSALAWLGRLINAVMRPFIHRNYLDVARAYAYAEEFAEGLSAIKGKHKNLIWPFLFSLNNKALLICVLALTFLAFGTPFSIGTIVGGFSIAYLFVIVSPTPAGLGVVEGALTLGLNSLRVPWEAAVLITLTYRAVTFWFPLGIGAVAFRMLHREPRGVTSEQ